MRVERLGAYRLLRCTGRPDSAAPATVGNPASEHTPRISTAMPLCLIAKALTKPYVTSVKKRSPVGRWTATSFRLLNWRPKKLLRITAQREGQRDLVGRWEDRTGRVVGRVWVRDRDSRGDIVAPSFGHEHELSTIVRTYPPRITSTKSAKRERDTLQFKTHRR